MDALARLDALVAATTTQLHSATQLEARHERGQRLATAARTLPMPTAARQSTLPRSLAAVFATLPPSISPTQPPPPVRTAQPPQPAAVPPAAPARPAGHPTGIAAHRPGAHQGSPRRRAPRRAPWSVSTPWRSSNWPWALFATAARDGKPIGVGAACTAAGIVGCRETVRRGYVAPMLAASSTLCGALKYEAEMAHIAALSFREQGSW